MAKLGIIGGTGFSDKANKNKKIIFGTEFGHAILYPMEISGRECLFAPRHEELDPPHTVDYKSILIAMEHMNVKNVISLSAVGRLGDDVLPGNLVLANQTYSYDVPRITTAGKGALIHAGMRNPVSKVLQLELHNAGLKPEGLGLSNTINKINELYDKSGLNLNLDVKKNGTYVHVHGPCFTEETAENTLRRIVDDSDAVIGMTSAYETLIARELEIALAVIAGVVDHSSHPNGPKSVTHSDVLEYVKFTGQAQFLLVQEALARTDLGNLVDKECHNALEPSVGAINVDMVRGRGSYMMAEFYDRLKSKYA